jgi:hypothetical protein
MIGWILLHRKLAKNPLWLCEPFTRGQAWVDLLLLANHEESFFYVRGNKVNIQIGQVGWSEPKLSERWKWSRTKIRKFLNDLEKEQQIIQQKNTITQIITIVNYKEYQKKEQQTGQQKDSRKTAERQQKDVDNNDNNDNKKNNTPPTPPKGESEGWKKNKEVYLSDLRNAYREILKDEEWIKKQEEFNPGINVQKSIEKTCTNYWATDAGWKKKKNSKIIDIDWKATLANAISRPTNRVWLNEKDEQPTKKRNNYANIIKEHGL